MGGHVTCFSTNSNGSNPSNSNGVLNNKESLTLAEAQAAFDVIANSGEIAWEVPDSPRCNFRAHLASKVLQDLGIENRKVWLMENGNIHVPNPFVKDHELSWGYHVAVLVTVKETEAGAPSKQFVMDPSLFSRPVPLEQWQKVLSRKTCVELPLETKTSEIKECGIFVTSKFYTRPSIRYGNTEFSEKDLDAMRLHQKDLLSEAKWRKEHNAGVPGTDGLIRPTGSCSLTTKSKIFDYDVVLCGADN